MSFVGQSDIRRHTTIGSEPAHEGDDEDEYSCGARSSAPPLRGGEGERQCPQTIAYNVVFQDLHTEIEKLEEKVRRLRESEYKLYTENELLQKYKLMIENIPKDMQWDYASNEWVN